MVDDGRTVRFLSEQGGSELVEGPRGPTRLVYLQHGSDPVVFFSPSLALNPPDWLLEGQRSPDVSPAMGWFPLVTFWQVALDLPGAGNVPYGYGNTYSQEANIQGWVDVTDPEGWIGQVRCPAGSPAVPTERRGVTPKLGLGEQLNGLLLHYPQPGEPVTGG